MLSTRALSRMKLSDSGFIDSSYLPSCFHQVLPEIWDTAVSLHVCYGWFIRIWQVVTDEEVHRLLMGVLQLFYMQDRAVQFCAD